MEDNSFHILFSEEDTINFCEFDSDFGSILLMINNGTLQKRSMENVNEITVSIKLEEIISSDFVRNMRL